MARDITVAFAGTGEVKKEAIYDLLDDFFGYGPKDNEGFPEPPEHAIRVIFPASVEHTSTTLEHLVNWTEYADLPYEVVLAKGDRDDSLETMVTDAEKVHEVANVDKKIVDLLATAPGEAFLVLAWDDEDEHAESLLDLAEVAGVRALDLTVALDDVSFADEETEEPAPAPEPEPEPTPRRRGRRAETEEPAAEERPRRGRRAAKEEALEEVEEPLEEPEPTVTPEEPQEAPVARRGRPRKPEPEVEEATPVEAPEEAPEPSWSEAPPRTDSPLNAEYLSGALQAIFLHLQAADAAGAYKNLADPVESPVAALAREALEHVTLGVPASSGEPAEGEERRGRGRPRQSPKTTGYLRNGDGVHRKAGRGRPRRGEEKVDLTDEEIADLRQQGMVLDED